MLNERQLKILNFLFDNIDEYISSQRIANHLRLSIRTIKKEISELIELSKNFDSFTIDSQPSKGFKLNIEDLAIYKKELHSIKNNNITYLDTKSGRIYSIINMILSNTSYVPKQVILDNLFISESTLYSYLKEIRSILKEYTLSLSYKTNYGYMIVGDEINKRKFLSHNPTLNLDVDSLIQNNSLNYIYDTVVKVFNSEKYKLDEDTFQNITSHIYRSCERIIRGHYLDDFVMDENIIQSPEYKIAEKILSTILDNYYTIYHLIPEKMLLEIYLLTQIILGKIELSSDVQLQIEISSFIELAMREINDIFFVDFSNNEKLKHSLSLHIVPLMYRARSGTQLTNIMKESIQRKFPLAVDIAIYFSLLMKSTFKINITDDEISYIALYFNYGLESSIQKKSNTKMLIITRLRNSETILLRHTIMSWFPEKIDVIDFVKPGDNISNIEEYNTIFSTEDNLDDYKGLVGKINVFPEEEDFKKIDVALNGFNNIKQITEKFSEDCFIYEDFKDKNEVLDLLIEISNKRYNIEENLSELVYARENYSTTHFGNLVALPHPFSPASDESFISTCILKEPIQWDSNHTAQVIMLVSIAKYSPKEFQLWFYISSIVQNKEFIDDIINNPSYSYFIEKVGDIIRNDTLQ